MLFASKVILLQMFPSFYFFLLFPQRDRSLGTEESLKKFLEMSKNDLESSDIIIEPNYIDALPSPRYIKSHLPLSCLPPNLVDRCKVVYVARNPKGIEWGKISAEIFESSKSFNIVHVFVLKDVAVSWYFHHLLDPIMNTTLKMEEFAEFFIRDEGENLEAFYSAKCSISLSFLWIL